MTTDYSLLTYEITRWSHRSWDELAPKIAFVLFLCGAIRKSVYTEQIAEQSAATYPDLFRSQIGGKKIPDTYIVEMALKQAKLKRWGYANGDWRNGWKLTRKGLAFAKDVERRKAKGRH
ncbi:MAG: hypothetical protein PHN82_11665 [bacterium]|nr:hypothetical protein [bacterium]